MTKLHWWIYSTTDKKRNRLLNLKLLNLEELVEYGHVEVELIASRNYSFSFCIVNVWGGKNVHGAINCEFFSESINLKIRCWQFTCKKSVKILHKSFLKSRNESWWIRDFLKWRYFFPRDKNSQRQNFFPMDFQHHVQFTEQYESYAEEFVTNPSSLEIVLQTKTITNVPRTE
jgi:hypothetical protein